MLLPSSILIILITLLAKIGESSKNDAILKEYGWKPAPKSASKF